MQFDFQKGLSAAQATQNLITYGRNILPEAKPKSRFRILLNQFASPLVVILIIAAGITLWFGDLAESVGILIIVILNSVLGFFQEHKAEATLASLTNTLKPKITVLRDGNWVSINTRDLVKGDIVQIKLGDKIPADGIFISSDNLSINEAVLTGESMPVAKSGVDNLLLERVRMNGFIEDNIVTNLAEEKLGWMGTAVMGGVGKMLITKVGIRTQFGKIASNIFHRSEAQTPLQLKISKFSLLLSIFIAVICLLMVGYGFLVGKEVIEIFELAVSIAVSAVPEGLVVALTVILALGMNRIFKRKALIRKMLAAETLGSVDTICVDKTGTLTLGIMKVVDSKFNDSKSARKGLLLNHHKLNAVDIAIGEWLGQSLTAQELVEIQDQVIDYKPFDSVSKFSAALTKDKIYYVGAPDLLLNNSKLTGSEISQWQEEINNLAAGGMRLVAVATKSTRGIKELTTELPTNLEWLGLVMLEDPIRPELKEVFAKTKLAGINIKLITGDFAGTALAVMHKIGIEIKPSQTISGAELSELDEPQLDHRIEDLRVFYRTTPEQKLRIVEALQRKGHVVAMMGDGINDAPALKQAEIGIVVDNATDFSKEIADMVLLDSNFHTIVAAIEEGRNIFENMRKVLTYLLIDAFDALVLVIGALLLNIPSPLLPLQILYINFLTDGLPDIALAFEESESEVMRDKPKPKNYPLLDDTVRALVLIVGVVVVLFVLAIYIWLLQLNLPLEFVRTVIFATVAVDSLLFVFSVRSLRKNIWHTNILGNKVLLWGVGFGILSIIAAIYLPLLNSILETTPLPFWTWFLIIGKSILSVLLIEQIKRYFWSYK